MVESTLLRVSDQESWRIHLISLKYVCCNAICAEMRSSGSYANIWYSRDRAGAGQLGISREIPLPFLGGKSKHIARDLYHTMWVRLTLALSFYGTWFYCHYY